MKILKRNSNIINIIIFQLFSVIYLHVLYSLVDGYSSLDLATINRSLEGNLSFIGLCLINILFIFMVKKISLKVLIVTSATASTISFLLFLESFNKTILLYNLLYIVISYFFCMIWKLELNEACYNSFFDKKILRPLGLNDVSVKLHEVVGDRASTGVITNWTVDTLFVATEEVKRLSGEVEVEILYKDTNFFFRGITVTSNAHGVGIKTLNEKKETTLNWLDFYDIITDRGITPTYL
ncbi:hypothetical protein [Halobacteriovorax sp. HLS]|uniref:hypothetical protein n=1 Tax=Halobacteriovorax sp. HLS TaxID=2234000 RepID=UPI000FD78F59|nr:hypothetical protein [Halobacteriovorax sp. HLS]